MINFFFKSLFIGLLFSTAACVSENTQEDLTLEQKGVYEILSSLEKGDTLDLTISGINTRYMIVGSEVKTNEGQVSSNSIISLKPIHALGGVMTIGMSGYFRYDALFKNLGDDYSISESI